MVFYCLFCQSYLGFSSEKYCDDCAKIRRVCLVIGTQNFLNKTLQLFLKDDLHTEISNESKTEFKQCIQAKVEDKDNKKEDKKEDKQ